MITKNEISDSSVRLGLSLDVIEKDYVLGWVLAAINHDSELKDNWIFKGGTCLKKCFFKDYRFSEDLDFTLMNKALVIPPYTKQESEVKIGGYMTKLLKEQWYEVL